MRIGFTKTIEPAGSVSFDWVYPPGGRITEMLVVPQGSIRLSLRVDGSFVLEDLNLSIATVGQSFRIPVWESTSTGAVLVEVTGAAGVEVSIVMGGALSGGGGSIGSSGIPTVAVKGG